MTSGGLSVDRTEHARRLPPIGSLIRHQHKVILASIAITLGLAVLYVVNLPSTYTATSAVLLSPAPGNPLTAEAASAGVVQMTVALETEAQMMRTPAVADVVTDELDHVTPDSGERLEVTVPSNTQMLQIAFTASTAERAQEGAQAFAEGYLEFRAERARAVQDTRINRLSEQIDATDSSLKSAIEEASGSGASVYESQQVQLLADRLAQLSNSLSTEESVSTDPGAVVNGAALPDSANELPAWVYLGAAALLGAIVGLGIALLREWRRDLLRESDDAGDLGVSVLAVIRLTAVPALAVDAGLAIHESYRRLRTAIIANGPRPYILAVTGVDTDLSAEVATNLAIVLAEARFSVLLISTDSQERAVEGLLDVRGGEGLAEVVLEGASAKDLLVETHGISLLTAGLREESRDLTATSAFRTTVNEVHKDFDYVIVAAAAAGSADGDSALLAADSALLVLAPGATSRTLLAATLDRLDRLGVDMIGAVNVSRPTPRDSAVEANREDGLAAPNSDAEQADAELVDDDVESDTADGERDVDDVEDDTDPADDGAEGVVSDAEHDNSDAEDADSDAEHDDSRVHANSAD